jgi:hypothetical protein
MKLLLGLVLAWVFLGGAAANAAPCDAGSTPDQDGCQTRGEKHWGCLPHSG